MNGMCEAFGKLYLPVDDASGNKEGRHPVAQASVGQIAASGCGLRVAGLRRPSVASLSSPRSQPSLQLALANVLIKLILGVPEQAKCPSSRGNQLRSQNVTILGSHYAVGFGNRGDCGD